MSQEELIPFQEEDESSMGSKSIPPAGSAGNPAQGGEEGARDEPLGKGGSRGGRGLKGSPATWKAVWRLPGQGLEVSLRQGSWKLLC